MATCVSGGRTGTLLPGGGCDTRAADLAAAGISVPSQQIGSQFWMNSGYSGPEPDLATKAKFSDAQVANAWANTYLAQANVNTQMGVVAKPNQWLGDPALNPAGINLWGNAPAVYQAQFAALPAQANPNQASAGITPQAGSDLAKLVDALQNGAYHTNTPNVPVVQGTGGYTFGSSGGTDTGTGTTSSDTGILGSLGIGALLVIGALVIGVFYLFSHGSGRGHGHGA